MFRNLSSTVVLFSLITCTPSLFAAVRQNDPRATREDAVIREVLDLERHAKEASLHNDVAFTEHAFADDYIAIGPLGNVITKADALNAKRRAQLHYDVFDCTEMVVRVYGDTAVVTARAEVKGKDLGEDFSGPYRFTRVWVRRNGEWQAVSYQATVTR